jgi:hypothetical protein
MNFSTFWPRLNRKDYSKKDSHDGNVKVMRYSKARAQRLLCQEYCCPLNRKKR